MKGLSEKAESNFLLMDSSIKARQLIHLVLIMTTQGVGVCGSAMF